MMKLFEDDAVSFIHFLFILGKAVSLGKLKKMRGMYWNIVHSFCWQVLQGQNFQKAQI